MLNGYRKRPKQEEHDTEIKASENEFHFCCEEKVSVPVKITPTA